MNLRIALILTGGLATGAIALTAALVLTRTEPMAQPELRKPSAAAVEAEQPRPDPLASGVIIAKSGNYYHWLEPSGARGSVMGMTYPEDGVSVDGRWQAGINWEDDKAFLAIFDRDSDGDVQDTKAVRLPESLVGAEWAPESPLLAALDQSALYLVDPESGEASMVAEGVTAYAWAAGDRLIYATRATDGARLSALDEDGRAFELAVLSGPVDRFYVAPERDQVLFTQDDPEGWRLLALNPANGRLHDYGSLGGRTLFQQATSPALAVAWSPDERRFAVGPVTTPYVMFLVDPLSETWTTYTFEEGYAGEMTWSPDGKQLAISTYSLDRTRHEVYVMDVAAGGEPRHLLDGCKIVWSPDGRFVAVKREPHDATGMAAIRVETGYHWALTTNPQYIPVAWGEDEEAALALTMNPVPYAVQLGK
jgi:hypothetical protein